MGDNDNSTSGYGGSDGGYGGSDTDTDSSYGGGYDGGCGDGDDDDGSDTDSYGNDGDSNDDYGGYDDSNDNSSYSEADDGITDDDMSVSPYSSCEDTDDVFDTDLDQTFSVPSYGGSGGWYESITAECEQAYNAVADTLSSFVDTLAGEKKDAETMSSELDMTDSVTISGSGSSGERAAEFASGAYDFGTGVVQAAGSAVAAAGSGGWAAVPAAGYAMDGLNTAVYGVGEMLAAGYDNPNYAWNPLESGYEDVAERLGVSKQYADTVYNAQEFALSARGAILDMGKLLTNETARKTLAVDCIGVGKNVYGLVTDQYRSMMEQLERGRKDESN